MYLLPDQEEAHKMMLLVLVKKKLKTENIVHNDLVTTASDLPTLMEETENIVNNEIVVATPEFSALVEETENNVNDNLNTSPETPTQGSPRDL